MNKSALKLLIDRGLLWGEAIANQCHKQNPSSSSLPASLVFRRLNQFNSTSALHSASVTTPAAVATKTTTIKSRASKTTLQKVRSLLRDYKQLSKARLSALVVATSAAGFVAGSQKSIDWAGLGWTSLGTMMAASSANALNQLYEVIPDAKMKRTALRPLPSGRMTRLHALTFAAALGIGGTYLLSQKTNNLTAALGAANIALYAGVYTPLKAITVANTWIGAAVGAVPPLMGWAAATGGLDAGSLILAAGLFFWQMPHFMALAWLCRADYAAGGYRMLSLIDATGKRTAAVALRHSLYLFPLGALSTWLGVTTPYFAYTSAFITAGMMLTAAKFYSSPTNNNARLLFRTSLLHLPIFMAAFLAFRIPTNTILESGQDRLHLLMKNARQLGINIGTSSSDEREEEGREEEDRVGSVPPMPFFLSPMNTLPHPTTTSNSSSRIDNDRK